MGKLAYYASRIAPDKPHQFVTDEGYRIYTAVPICRTGFQEYLGKELKEHPDYDPAWGLDDEQIVKVFRPKEVVTSPETVASFEGKSVLDGHPPADVAVVTVETEGEYGRGHTQNVRVGAALEDGETPLLADLFVKNQPLNDKIDGGVRDVSCGYTYGLDRAEDGTFVMTKICGNHVAVVPKGRAGPEVSIRDAAPDAIRTNPEIKTKEAKMAIGKDNFWGRMLKRLAASDADPEDMEKLAKMAKDEDESEKEKKAADDKAAKDKAAKDAAEKGEVELHPRLAKACDQLDAVFEHLGVGKEKEPEVTDPTAGDADVLEMEGDDKGKPELPAQIADADTIDLLKVLRPKVVAAKDAAITKVFNERVRSIKAAANDSVYSGLATGGSPHDQDVTDVDPTSFFNGVSYAEGVRRLNEHKAQLAISKKGGK